MSEKKDKIYISVRDRDGECTWYPIDEDELMLGSHDARIACEAIDCIVKILKARYPIFDNGFYRANESLHQIIDEVAEQVKERYE